MKFCLQVLLLASIAAPCTLGQAQQSTKLKLSGIVTDLRSRGPIEGARVTLVGNQANPEVTDSGGFFILSFPESVPQGNSVRIRIEKTGYKSYDKWVAVSTAIPLQVSLEAAAPRKTLPTASHIYPASPIAKVDSFGVLVPLHAEWKNTPIPINSNLTDPRQEFYDDLVELADRPEIHPDDWPPYKERKFESLDEQFHFVTRLVQFELFRSIYRLQRGVSGGVKMTFGVGVTPINERPILAPDSVPYPTEDVLNLLANNEFLVPMDKMLWKNKPLPIPLDTHISFIEHENPEKGEVFTCTVRLERSDSFRIDFEVQPGPSINNQLPAGFSSQAVQGTTTYNLTVSMKYEIQRKKDHGFEPTQYSVWADSLFDGLKKKMSF
jgi:hypothetical protein